MVNYKEWNIKHFGNILILSFVLLLIIAMVHIFVGPLLTTILPSVFTSTIALTDTLLFLILVRLVVK